MRATVLDSHAKETLRKTVRGLRGRLLEQLEEAAKGEYRLDLDIEKARLPEARHLRRKRLEEWLDEQSRAAGKAKNRSHFKSAVKEAAHTLLNRLVLLRILEHHRVLAPAVVRGGWSSPAYEQEFAKYAGPLTTDETRGYQALLEVVFAELALELPGLFGHVGLTALFPIPAAMLREVVEALNDPALDTAWGDDTTLGWVYQYWNDPEREDLDKKIADGGKVEPHEIASKTQMFTERYMVEWLLQNSLGLTWLCICKKNGWTPDAEVVLPVLDARRAEWRGRREKGDVALDALMPIAAGLESAWKYYVLQPIPNDAVGKSPASIRELKLLDPACGSGHFLVIAFDLLAGMYREEAKHRGEEWAEASIAESILANNLHGIDIDPRALQIAAAGLWLKAKLAAPGATLGKMNLVAPRFGLGALPKDDPALVKLCKELAALAVPEALTRGLVESLRGVDHLGTLLRVDRAIEALLGETAKEEGPLLAYTARKRLVTLEARVAEFLDAHAAEADLGLRLEGEQLAAGLRFVELVKDGTYDIVVGNPPYQGLSKTKDFEYVTKNYPRGKADLYAAFLERGLELVREGGVSALLTMRGWMFLGQFKDVRKAILESMDLRMIGDVDRGAFEDVPDEVLATAMSVIRRALPVASPSIAVQPTPLDDHTRDSNRTARKRAGLLGQVGRYEFHPKGFAVIEGEPIVYWWTKEFLERYGEAPKLGARSPARFGVTTGNNRRFLRLAWEVSRAHLLVEADLRNHEWPLPSWVPFVMGASGRVWVEPLSDIGKWERGGLEMRVFCETSPGANIRSPQHFFALGVAFSMIGATFTARAHRFASVIGNKGSSVFPANVGANTCLMNSGSARFVLQSLNPGIGFEVGDVNRLPIFPVANADDIFATIDRAFTEHESHREPSVEFTSPGPSPWRHAQDWAQLAVDRPEGAPLPVYVPEYDQPNPQDPVSFAIGIALGRFGANGEGVVDTAPPTALLAGILFVAANEHVPDSLSHAAAAPILAAWDTDHRAILNGKKSTLRDWLRKDFFSHHKALYENCPIYFPLSSRDRSFVAWTSIHRWSDNTLQILVADHLNPVLRQLEGEITNLNQDRASSDKKTAQGAERQYAATKKLRDELAEFIAGVRQCAERGAPRTDPTCSERKADAPFHMDLDDGVMINSAGLWPLLAPQWNDPKKWWKLLCVAEGRKDYDWSHLAQRYFPERVEEKCKTDPSLAVAHGCFWKYHPAKAYQWELRLKDEIRPDFTIDEADSDVHRDRFLKERPDEGRAIQAAETKRRERKSSRDDTDDGPDLQSDDGDEPPALS